jgi:hypothetical protein
MKRVGLYACSFVLAMSVLIGGPGMARAIPVMTQADFGGTSYFSQSGSLITVTEESPVTNPWYVEATNGNDDLVAFVTGGKIEFDNVAETVAFYGNLSTGGTLTGLVGTLSNSGQNSDYYSWAVLFTGLSNLNNGSFTMLDGIYQGGISIDLSGSSNALGTFSSFSSSVTFVPIPASALLFAPGLLGLLGTRRRLKG